MRRFYFLGFLLLLFFDTFGQISFKLTALSASPLEINLDWFLRIFSSRFACFVIISYAGSFITWMILLKKAPIGPAFAVSHLQVVTVTLVSVVIFNEAMTWTRVLGALLIIVGIIFLALAEQQNYRKKGFTKKLSDN